MAEDKLLLEIAKIGSGGLFGAFFTFLAGRALARRDLRRISLEIRTAKYRGPAGTTIMWGSAKADELSTCDVEIVNTGKRSIESLPLVVVLEHSSSILQVDVKRSPVPAQFERTDEGQTVRLELADIQPKDTLSINMLFAGRPPSSVLVRDASVEIDAGVTASELAAMWAFTLAPFVLLAGFFVVKAQRIPTLGELAAWGAITAFYVLACGPWRPAFSGAVPSRAGARRLASRDLQRASAPAPRNRNADS